MAQRVMLEILVRDISQVELGLCLITVFQSMAIPSFSLSESGPCSNKKASILVYWWSVQCCKL